MSFPDTEHFSGVLVTATLNTAALVLGALASWFLPYLVWLLFKRPLIRLAHAFQDWTESSPRGSALSPGWRVYAPLGLLFVVFVSDIEFLVFFTMDGTPVAIAAGKTVAAIAGMCLGTASCGGLILAVRMALGMR